jgi:hypothetical protein
MPPQENTGIASSVRPKRLVGTTFPTREHELVSLVDMLSKVMAARQINRNFIALPRPLPPPDLHAGDFRRFSGVPSINHSQHFRRNLTAGATFATALQKQLD